MKIQVKFKVQDSEVTNFQMQRLKITLELSRSDVDEAQKWIESKWSRIPVVKVASTCTTAICHSQKVASNRKIANTVLQGMEVLNMQGNKNSILPFVSNRTIFFFECVW